MLWMGRATYCPVIINTNNDQAICYEWAGQPIAQSISILIMTRQYVMNGQGKEIFILMGYIIIWFRPIQLHHFSLFPFYRWTWVSPCLLEQRMMEVLVTTGAISRAKIQSNHHHQQTNIQFLLQAGCPSCRPTNSFKALKGKYHIPWTCLPQAHLEIFQLGLWPLIAPGNLGGGLPCLSSAASFLMTI